MYRPTDAHPRCPLAREMADAVGLKTAILYQNPAKTVTLIDIPTSVSLAQGTLEIPNSRKLYSSPPLQFPYPSTEPKSAAAKAKVREMMGSAHREFSTELLCEALRQIGDNYSGEWCLPRQIPNPASMGANKKCKYDGLAMSNGEARIREPDLRFPSTQHEGSQDPELQSLLELSKSLPYDIAIALDVQSMSQRLVHNPYSTRLPLHISLVSQTYIIPPRASFFLTSIDRFSFRSFSHAASEVYPISSSSAGPGQFDIILLDPPWNNCSVRRSREYTTLRQETNPMDVLHDMLGTHIAPGSLVGCWITNKPSVRDIAMKAFENWDVSLIQEWAWLKTTVHGHPMSRINGLWRKPYEILLLGRKRSAERDKTIGVGDCVQRRVIVAVPDLHSRKPNLKELLESMMPNPLSYRALEIFPRNLTAGWWSWGDEVLKFNWEGNWSKHN